METLKAFSFVRVTSSMPIRPTTSSLPLMQPEDFPGPTSSGWLSGLQVIAAPLLPPIRQQQEWSRSTSGSALKYRRLAHLAVSAVTAIGTTLLRCWQLEFALKPSPKNLPHPDGWR